MPPTRRRTPQPPTRPPRRGGFQTRPAEPALTATLAAALEADAAGDEDRTLARFLRSVETSAPPNPEEAAALRAVADRIETGNGDYPALVRAAAEPSGGNVGDERERASHASRTVIRPLAARGTDGAR